MLTASQIEFYHEKGYVVVPDVIPQPWLAKARDTLADLIERSRDVSASNSVYDLEDAHSQSNPRVRRIKDPHINGAIYGEMLTSARIMDLVVQLIGPNLRMDHSKLNIKPARGGEPVEWHQDWAFYPHTNDDLAAVGIMMDDMELANGPLMIIPGSHKGPIFDHHTDGRFCGAMDPATKELDYAKAIPLTGAAGSITVHHVRAVHGSAPNTSNKERRLLLLQYRAADAWPLLGLPAGMEAYDKLMVAGAPTNQPRLAPVPVRLPLPPADLQGSIYENQKGLKRRFFDAPEGARQPELQPAK